MLDDRAGRVETAPSRLAGPQTKVAVFAIEEVVLVEAPQRAQQRTAVEGGASAGEEDLARG